MFRGYVADAADQIVGGGLASSMVITSMGEAWLCGRESDGCRRLPRIYRASIVFQNSVHVELAFAIRLK